MIIYILLSLILVVQVFMYFKQKSKHTELCELVNSGLTLYIGEVVNKIQSTSNEVNNLIRGVMELSLKNKSELSSFTKEFSIINSITADYSKNIESSSDSIDKDLRDLLDKIRAYMYDGGLSVTERESISKEVSLIEAKNVELKGNVKDMESLLKSFLFDTPYKI